MRISKFTRFIVSFCAFFIGAIPGFFLTLKMMNPGKVYPYTNSNVLFDGWDQIPMVLGMTIVSGIVFVVISILILNKVSLIHR